MDSRFGGQLLLYCAFLSAGPFGCSDTEKTAHMTLVAFTEALLQAQCTHLVACAAEHQSGMRDVQTCMEERRDLDAFGRDLRQAAAIGQIRLDAAKAEQCLAALPTDCAETYAEWPQICWDAVQGQVPDGQCCNRPWVCASDVCDGGVCVAGLQAGASCDPQAPLCTPPLACSAGKCVQPRSKTQGTACTFHIDCANGLSCQNGKCQPLRALDEQCGEGDCAPPLWCGPSSTCEEPATLGSACGALGGSEQGACVAGARCEYDEFPKGYCVPNRPLGAACANDLQCGGQEAGCLLGLCTLRPAVNEPCTAVTRCRGLNYCDQTTGLCTSNEDLPCADDFQVHCRLLGLTCRDGQCMPRGKVGAACDHITDCAEPLACDAVTHLCRAAASSDCGM